MAALWLVLSTLIAAACSSPSTAASPAASPTAAADTVAPGPTVSTQTVAPTTAPTIAPSAPPATSAYVNSTYGFTVMLPTPYRRSARLSIASTGGQRPAAADAFTALPEADEAALARQSCETACPVWNYVAVIDVFTGTGVQTPRDFYNAFSYSQGQVIEDLLVDGHQAVKVTNAPSYPIEYLIKGGDRMFMLGYTIYSFFDVPSGATRAKLDAIITSFRFVS